MPINKHHGFTLLEILIALAILAVALAAAMRVAGMASMTVTAYKQRTLALWVAQNRLVEHRAKKDRLALGSLEGETQQADLKFHWHETISSTPRQDFQRIDVKVSNTEDPYHTLIELTGFLAHGKK